MFRQRRGQTFGDVSDQGEFGVREGGDDSAVIDAEPGESPRQPGQFPEHRTWVEPAVDVGESGDALRVEADPALGAQIVHEHRVQFDRGGEVEHEIFKPSVARTQRHRAEQDRSGWRL